MAIKNLLFFTIAIASYALQAAQPTLFTRYPTLAQTCGYVPLGTLPTPLMSVDFAMPQGPRSLTIKRDDLFEPNMGSNKLRKLCFILGHAQQVGAKELVTFGRIGSNHAAATAYAAKQCNLPCHLMLLPQHLTPQVTKNLLIDAACQANIHYFTKASGRELALYKLNDECIQRHGKGLYEIVVGGSNEQGVIAFADAAFELIEQCKNQALPLPDYVYLPCSSAGTTAGLVLGFALAQVPTKVVGVLVEQVTSDSMREKVADLVQRGSELLTMLDATIPNIPADLIDDHLMFDQSFTSLDYAQSNPDIDQALAVYQNLVGAPLETTYSGKAWAALLQQIQRGSLQEKHVVFWHTYNSNSTQDIVAQAAISTLPKELQHLVEPGCAIKK